MVVGEWPFFGCEILLFWLRNRLFLVAESFFLVAEVPFLGCGSASDFGCGIAEIWLRKRRNMVSESEFILCFPLSMSLSILSIKVGGLGIY